MFGGSNTPSAPAAPTWNPDPLVNQTDNSMFNFGSNVLQGILPTQYQDLIQTNSPQFQTMLKNSNAQIQGAGLSTAAMNGNARSGAADAGITSAIASNTANLSYSDLLNTQLNQKAILGTGLNAIQSANTGALTNQGQQNNFNLGVFNGQNQQYSTQMNYNDQMTQLSAKLGGQLSEGIGSGISNLPFMNSGSNPGGLTGQLGAFDSITGTAGAGGTAAGAAAFAGTDGIDALLASGAPLMLAA